MTDQLAASVLSPPLWSHLEPPSWTAWLRLSSSYISAPARCAARSDRHREARYHALLGRDRLMDLHEYLSLLRRRWRLLAACVLVAGVAAWVTTPAKPKTDTVTYTATHQLLRDSSANSPAALATVSLFVKTGEVPKRSAERLGYKGNPVVLAAGITLEPNEQVGTLDITAKGSSPSQAAEKANVFAEETLGYLGEQAAVTQQDQIQRANEQLDKLQADIDDLESQITAATADGQSIDTLKARRDSLLRQYGAAFDQQQNVLDQPPPSAGYITLQPALPELAKQEAGGFSAPSSRPARTALAVIVGLLLGLGVVLLTERLDTRIHDVGAAAGSFGLPVIAEVPSISAKKADRHIVSALEPMSAMAESYRTLRSALVLSPITVLGLTRPGQAKTTEDPKVILVTSPAPGDGKTTTVSNLAVTMAEAGRRVLVLGCDFRRPEIHSYFGVPAAPGIADLLTSGLSTQRLEAVVRATGIHGISIAPSGSKLRSFGDVAAAGRDLVEQARALADIVIIDTAPLLATNDASELIPACDAVVVVSRIGKTTTDGARRTRFLLERLGAPVAGVVAVGVDSHMSYASYYTSAAEGADASEGSRRQKRITRKSDLDGGVAPLRPDEAPVEGTSANPAAAAENGGGAPKESPEGAELAVGSGDDDASSH